MTSKIFRSTILVAAIVLLCSLGLIMGCLYDYFDTVQVNQLKDELSLAAAGTEQGGLAFLESVESDRFRITWVAADGVVLYDTQASAGQMENHGNREEIREALKSGYGSASRHSETLLERTIYEAKRLSDGTVLRISISQTTLVILVFGMLHPVLVVAVIAIILSAVLAKRMSKKIVEPLNQLDLEHPLENEAYEEISPLLRRINQQHLQISRQMQTLKRKTDEFDQITGNMQEGLVLLDGEGKILSINPTARAIFDAQGECVGNDFLTVDRSREMRGAVNAAMDSGHGTARAQRGGREYQFDLSRIESDGHVVGAVVLAVDVTEQYNAERNRREFSANVSHELKTPLQSIIGSAELLENGLVKPEDTARFVGHIRKEAARLVALVEDIIRLSQLDEGVQIPREDVDLLALSEEAAATLQETARNSGVTIRVSGEHCFLSGVRRLLFEIVYNLCDNAVKYNHAGGCVDIRVEARDENTVLIVKDTGIGIPAEHQSRVFERFYRVDKSHSKASGGTGLGLSIVKHAAAFHDARIDLESTPGQGTTVTILF
ncbi:MAG: PAS domain-containing protein [Oscillospiraceae bacterium]|nr:PAS domain-containing protein [Oscillospiraceae bacterium]